MANKETRLTDQDYALIKSMFADNDANLKVLRKIFFPELSADNPVGMNFDLWTQTNFDGMSAEEMVIAVQARKMLVMHVEACLQMLKTIAGSKEETPEQTKNRLMKDSAK